MDKLLTSALIVTLIIVAGSVSYTAFLKPPEGIEKDIVQIRALEKTNVLLKDALDKALEIREGVSQTALILMLLSAISAGLIFAFMAFRHSERIEAEKTERARILAGYRGRVDSVLPNQKHLDHIEQVDMRYLY